MTSPGRVDLTALRGRAEHAQANWQEAIEVWPEHVLALVEAVEAAREVSDTWQAALICDECEENDGWCLHHFNRTREGHAALRAALVPFAAAVPEGTT